MGLRGLLTVTPAHVLSRGKCFRYVAYDRWHVARYAVRVVGHDVAFSVSGIPWEFQFVGSVVAFEFFEDAQLIGEFFAVYRRVVVGAEDVAYTAQRECVRLAQQVRLSGWGVYRYASLLLAYVPLRRRYVDVFFRPERDGQFAHGRGSGREFAHFLCLLRRLLLRPEGFR